VAFGSRSGIESRVISRLGPFVDRRRNAIFWEIGTRLPTVSHRISGHITEARPDLSTNWRSPETCPFREIMSLRASHMQNLTSACSLSGKHRIRDRDCKSNSARVSNRKQRLYNKDIIKDRIPVVAIDIYVLSGDTYTATGHAVSGRPQSVWTRGLSSLVGHLSCTEQWTFIYCTGEELLAGPRDMPGRCD
jgi:hypothetical protein